MHTTLLRAMESWSSKKRPASTSRLRTCWYSGSTPSTSTSRSMPPPTGMRSWISTMGEAATMPGTWRSTACMSSTVRKSPGTVLTEAFEPPS